MASKKQALLRFYDAADNLLYIARTRFPDRDASLFPRKTSGWQTTIARHTVEWFGTETTCTRASRRAHHEEQPLHPDPTLDLSPPRTKPVFVYRLYDATDQLLYVGQTNDPRSRLTEQQFRFPTTVRHTLEEYPDRISASAAEGYAIEHEHPSGNVVRGRHGPTEEPRERRSPYKAAQDIRSRFDGGELTVRQMFEELLMFPGVTARKAAHLLGFDDGPPPARYQHKNRGGTVDEMLRINNLNPDGQARDMLNV